LSRNQRFILLGLAAVVLVVAFVVARSGSSEEEGGSKSASDTTSTTDNQQEAPTGDAHRPRKPAAPQVATIVVKGGKPVGGVKRITFRKNGQIVFVVRSDVADEVHFHGYDIAKDVKAGGSVRFTTKAKIDGRFEVELEDRGTQIAEVEVTP
jgi:hypothetical protein